MKDFVAIDFETANQHRSSICSLGLVIVREGVITEKIYSLVKPTPNFYCSWTTDIHGITPMDTNESLLFPEVWTSIIDKIEGLPFVAHNRPFDESCLKAVFDSYKLPYPNYRFYCTLQAARKVFPNIRNHRLNTVASHCGFELENHHHALADAEACAHIALQII